jgi:hypothetical protein
MLYIGRKSNEFNRKKFFDIKGFYTGGDHVSD